MSSLGYWTPERPSSCWTSLTSRAGRRTTGRKYRGPLSVHLATDFSGKPTPAAGRRPLPDVSDLQAKARAWGIRSDSVVVVYDNSGGAQASRAWWTLRWAGLANVRVLDGGYGAWIATGRPSSNHVATHAALAGDVVLTSGGMPTIDAEEAAALATQSRLLDARPRAAYAGDPAKPGTGHIPGAIHAAAGDNIADGKFKSNDELRARFSSLGADGSTTDRGLLRQRQCGCACHRRHERGWAQGRALCRLVVGMERRSISPRGDGS